MSGEAVGGAVLCFLVEIVSSSSNSKRLRTPALSILLSRIVFCIIEEALHKGQLPTAPSFLPVWLVLNGPGYRRERALAVSEGVGNFRKPGWAMEGRHSLDAGDLPCSKREKYNLSVAKTVEPEKVVILYFNIFTTYQSSIELSVFCNHYVFSTRSTFFAIILCWICIVFSSNTKWHWRKHFVWMLRHSLCSFRKVVTSIGCTC